MTKQPLNPPETRKAPSVRCWFCDAEIDSAWVEADGFLVPRHTVEGGPLWTFPCPSCEIENGAERNRAGEFLLVPCVGRGVAGWIASLFDVRRTRIRAHARAWWSRSRKRRRIFHEAPTRPRAATPPPPRQDEPPAEPEPPPGPDPRPAGEPARVLEHYGTLEVPLTASRDDIAAAYRRLSQRCHPDKVAHLDEEFQELAKRKFRALREAYEALMDAVPDE